MYRQNVLLFSLNNYVLHVQRGLRPSVYSGSFFALVWLILVIEIRTTNS